MPKARPETVVHGSEREGWWWFCTGHCPDTPANQFVFKRDAHSAAARHRADNPAVDWDLTRSLQW